MIFRVGQREKKEDFPDKGERLAILSICTDMSRFVQRQKELEAKDALSDYLFKNLPGGHVRCSTEEGQLFFMGFSVDRAEDGIFCVDELEKAPDGTYDRMLVDIQMPNMDGYKATKIIRRLPEEESGYPILAMTAQASDECAQSCHQVGMNGRLVKPLDAKKLAKSIREAVQNQQ